MRTPISPYGEASDIAVPIGQSITVTSKGPGITTIYLQTLNRNTPLFYQKQQILRDAEVTLGPYTAVRYFKITATDSAVEYEVATNIIADNVATFPSVLTDQSATRQALHAMSPLRIVTLAGDSLFQGGNNVMTSGLTFSGAGNVGTITGFGGVVGGTIFITNAVQPEWNGQKTIATVSSANGGTITFNNPTPLTANPTVLSPFSAIYMMDELEQNSYHALSIANGLMGLPFNRIINRAGAGRRSDHVLAAFKGEVLSTNPDVIVYMCGVNDITSDYPTAGDDLTPFNNAVACAQLALATGALFVFCTSPPVGTTAGVYSTARRNTMERYNRRVRNYCAGKAGVILCDIHAASIAPTTGDWAANATTDGIHRSALGAFLWGTRLYTTLNPIFGQPLALVCSQIDNSTTDASSKQIFPNPLMQGSGGSSDANTTGTIPSNLFVQRYAGSGVTGVASVVARADGFGNNLRMVLSNAVNADQMQVQDSASRFASVTAGQVVQFSCSVKRSGVTGLNGVLVQLEGTANGNGFVVTASGSQGSNDTTTDTEIAYQTPPLTIPAGLTYLRALVRYQFGGAGGGTIEVGRWSESIIG